MTPSISRGNIGALDSFCATGDPIGKTGKGLIGQPVVFLDDIHNGLAGFKRLLGHGARLFVANKGVESGNDTNRIVEFYIILYLLLA